MAIYAADIQINVKNKGELRTLESRFKKIETAAVSLNKTLKGLGRRNAIRVDTRAAMSAISALEARIRGLNRTVNLDARTSESRSGGGGMSGAAMPILATAFSSRLGGSKGSGRSILSRRRQELAGTVDTAKMAKLAELEKKIATAMEKQSRSAEKLTKATAAKDSRTQQIKDLDAQWENLSKVITGKKSRSRFGSREINVLEGQRDAVDKLRKSLMSEKIEKVNSEHAAKQLNDERKKALKILEDEKEIIKSGSKEKLESLKLTGEQKTAQEEFNKLNVKAGELESKLLQKKDAITQAEERQQKAKNVLNQTQGKINKGLNVNADTLRRQKGELESANKSLASHNRWYKKWEDELRGVGKQIDSVTEKQKLLNTATAKMPAGGLMGQLRGGFKGLGAKGAMGSMGKGALGAMALIPGAAPFALGAGIGQANKTGGEAVAGGMMGAVGAGAIMGTVAMVEFGRASAQVAAEMDRMRIALGGVVPDQESYNTSLEKVSKLSNKYAISQRTILKGFTQLQASADAAGFSVEDTGKLMEGLLARTLASGKGIEEFKGVMLAASQILSKGKLQAEEARGQIGERIPGFMADLASSMGVSMQRLDKMMEQGEVTLKDFFKLGEDLLINNEKIAQKMASSYANAGMRLAKSVEDLQIAVGARTMIIGAKFQNMGKVIVDAVTEVIKILNMWRIAELKLTIAIGRGMQFMDDFSKGRLFDEDRLKEGPNDYLAREIEELRILTGEQEILTKKKKEQFEAEVKGALQKQQQFDKAMKNMEIEKDFLQDQLDHGTRYAELEREIALMVITHGKDKEDAIRTELRARQDLEDQLKSEVVTRGKINDMIEANDQKLKDLVNPLNQVQAASDAIGTAFGDAVREVVKGTKSIGDAVADMLDRIADHFLQTAADMMAQQASNFLFKTIASAIGGGLGGGTNIPQASDTYNFPIGDYDALSSQNFSTGGYVDRPTKGLIGEGGEGEYVIKESQMAGAMNRWSQGNRGKSVIHGSDGGVGSNQAGGSSELVVNYTGPSLVFNEQEYLPKSAVPEIINSAARRGAEAGQSKVLSQLKNSRSQRSRVGL